MFFGEAGDDQSEPAKRNKTPLKNQGQERLSGRTAKTQIFFKGCEISELINGLVWKYTRKSDTPNSEHGSRKCVTTHQTINKHTKQ